MSLCLRCRLALSFPHTPSLSLLFQQQQRLLSGPISRTSSRKHERLHAAPSSNGFRLSVPTTGPTTAPSSDEHIPNLFMQNVRAWTSRPRVRSRFRDFGIPDSHTSPLLQSFAAAVERGELHQNDELRERYGLTRFGQGLQDLSLEQAENELDIIYSTIFFTWTSESRNREELLDVLAPSTPHVPASTSSLAILTPNEADVSPLNTLLHIQRLSQAASRQYPSEEYPSARRMHRRIIMHVGPTNSGKTHHALRALAAARTGVYAGPLRLLAHEIWERLNLGEIVPLGVDESPPKSKATAKTYPRMPQMPDYLQGHPSLIRALRTSRRGNPAYARPCNMITGEEQKIVSEAAPLLSCTVEMLSQTKMYDVAVVDEIQMISDPERGAGWTSAVLGLCAREIHLCGEETSVPVIQALLRETGDQIEIRKYERLTPLMVEEESLDGDYAKVREGDCVVAFSRSGIFGIKRQIEEQTGMRCAVVYGKLPPEIRSEQARLFNDPNSGYDVIIGSDAIGMGLNLKIRRIIFDSVSKWTEGSQRRLSTSQVKQISGRAGRYGLLGPSSLSPKTEVSTARLSGGTTTTLYPTDLPFLRQALAESTPLLRYARIGAHSETFTRLAHVLPRGSSTFTVYEAHIYAGRLGPNYRYAMPEMSQLKGICELVDEEGGKVAPMKNHRHKGDEVETLGGLLSHLGLDGESSTRRSMTIADRMLLCLAPIPWRDLTCVQITRRLVKMYQERLEVNLNMAIKGTGFMEALEGIESLNSEINFRDSHMKTSDSRIDNSLLHRQKKEVPGANRVGKPNQTTLSLLETFHKILVLYLWMSYRNPASWSNREEVSGLKMRVERALERCLEGLSRKTFRRQKIAGIRKDDQKRWEKGSRINSVGSAPKKIALGLQG
ncbi:hypothetical protein AX17_001931 [Amanita inopinata Kibby_2008]|nr:hypothetical protein AX17_001931 [Amanita inopinata Kibby_2008]